MDNLTNGRPSYTLINYVESEIIHDRLSKGDRLPTERKLAEDLNISRASVREGLCALQAMGIVAPVQGSGNYITDRPEESIDRSLAAQFALFRGSLNDLMELRISLEYNACLDIIRYASEEEIAMVAALADYDYDLQDVEFQSLHDRTFHKYIMSLCHNKLIRYLYVTLSSLIDVYRDRVFIATLEKNDNSTTHKDHMEIADTLVHRDTSAIYDVLYNHLILNSEYQKMLGEQTTDNPEQH